ncbi:MAG: DUF429 domain-containing protein [Thermoleophilia bacterium]
MRTLGIDLAAEPKGTAVCAIDWEDGRAAVDLMEPGAADPALWALARGADKVGVDCPLGWPDAFVEAVAAHAAGEAWPGRDAADPAGFRRSLRLRATDEAVVASIGVTPLSVSTDRIGVTAMRAALLCDQLARQGGDVRRDGAGLVAEVYPAAALVRWGLPARGYKAATAAGRRLRGEIVDGIRSAAPWLALGRGGRAACAESHDVLDALVSALVARAAALGRTAPPPPEITLRVAREGWIHVPDEDALPGLAAA